MEKRLTSRYSEGQLESSENAYGPLASSYTAGAGGIPRIQLFESLRCGTDVSPDILRGIRKVRIQKRQKSQSLGSHTS